MINSITGKCSYYPIAGKDVCVGVSVGDIEFIVFISLSTRRQLDREVKKKNEKSKLFIHLLHKEDRMQLFGFYTDREREVFLKLIKVKGVGEKTALRILSIEADDLMKSIERRDQGRLTEIEGVGLKIGSSIIGLLGGGVKKINNVL
jgi:Holliday junction DNA helicase RuvA subunit